MNILSLFHFIVPYLLFGKVHQVLVINKEWVIFRTLKYSWLRIDWFRRLLHVLGRSLLSLWKQIMSSLCKVSSDWIYLISTVFLWHCTYLSFLSLQCFFIYSHLLAEVITHLLYLIQRCLPSEWLLFLRWKAAFISSRRHHIHKTLLVETLRYCWSCLTCVVHSLP